MEPATPQDLCNALARSNLHPPDEARALLKRFQQEDAASFARCLIAQGKLSDFQSGHCWLSRFQSSSRAFSHPRRSTGNIGPVVVKSSLALLEKRR